MRQWNRVLYASSLFALSVLSCDPRTAEPTVSQDRPSPAKSATPPKRCIRETPAKPRRIVIGGVNPACPEDEGPVPNLERKVVEIPDAEGGPQRVDAEIAKQNAERMRGLMYRRELPENDGMLFIFEQEKDLAFWMRNTCISLDMIFIADDGVIVGIEENTPTLSDDTFTPGCPARYVLEVNAGWTRKHGVKAGMKVKLPS